MELDDPELENAVRRALQEQGLDASFHSTVAGLAVRDSDEWRACCGSGCDPCVLRIAPAVDRVRALLREPQR